jgi:hypothetical protein
MKKKYTLMSAVCVLTFILVSCADTLDADHYFKDRMTIEEVFTDRDYSEQWLANAYYYLTINNTDVSSKKYNPFCFADDMYYGDTDDRYKRLKNGDYDENFLQGSWIDAYKGIRQASIFILNIDMNEQMTPEERADYKAQARFVRSYFYWLLLRKYGPVPLLPDEGIDYTKEYDDLGLPRNSYDECVEYISNEMLLAAKDLPLSRSALYIARPTRGAALATRAKALLYAASPINNPRPGDQEKFADMVNWDGKHLIAQEYDDKKWAIAAAAARDVIELGQYDLYHAGVRRPESAMSGFPATITPPDDGDFSNNLWPNGWKDIDPFESYRAIFNGSLAASDNPELIFTRGQNLKEESVSQMVLYQLPPLGNGFNTHGITQKQCDAYYMNNGTDCPGKDMEIGRGNGSKRAEGFVTWEEETQKKYPELDVHEEGVSKQYVQREPRFYASVAFNGSTWYFLNRSQQHEKNLQVFYYRGSGNGYTNTSYWLRTGIGVKKFVHPNDCHWGNDPLVTQYIQKKVDPAIRYADILLMYAEALNEVDGTYNIPSWDGAKSYAIKRDIDEMKRGTRPVRCRAGLPDFKDYGSKDAMRANIKRERQIELMGEGQRYYDLRRWKDAEVEESLPIYGCNTLLTVDQRELFHIPVEVASLPTNFSRKMYFWPISHQELKRNKKLVQNPGWTYNE